MNLFFLKIFPIDVYGSITIVQIITNFYSGFTINSLVYFATFDMKKKLRFFTIKSLLYFFIFAFIISQFCLLLDVNVLIGLFLVIKTHNFVLNEFFNRYCFNIKSNLIIYQLFVIRLIEIISLLFIFWIYSFTDFLFILKFIIAIELILMIYAYFRLYNVSRNNFNKFSFYSMFKNEYLFNNIYNIVYYLKGNTSPILLGIFSLEAIGYFSSTRYFASPITLLTPVLASIIISFITTQQNKAININFFNIISFVIVYIIIVLILDKYFYQYFLEEYTTTYTIYTLVHIFIALLAITRSSLESVFQALKKTKKLFQVNLRILILNLFISIILIYFFNIYGALFSLMLIEIITIFILYLYARNNNLLQAFLS